MAHAVDVSRCPKQDVRAALALVLQSLPADQSGPLVDSLARLRNEPLGPFDALVIAKRGGRMIAAAWGQPQPGKTASLWTPRSAQDALPVDLNVAMVEKVTSCVDDAGVAVTQALLESEDDATVRPLVRSGFRRVAELLYMEWTPSAPPRAAHGDETEFAEHDPEDRARLERLTSATYVDTLDCPEVDGLRDIRDVIDGYRCAGEHQPGLWRIIRRGGEDVGVLLLTEYPASQQMELVYMGVVPSARGCGVGASAVRKTQEIARARDARRLVLAVDARNRPAMDIYHAAGFRRWARRFAYLRRAGGAPG